MLLEKQKRIERYITLRNGEEDDGRKTTNIAAQEVTETLTHFVTVRVFPFIKQLEGRIGRRRKFIDKKNSATFQLIARDASDPSFSQSNRVFARVDNNPVSFSDAEDAGFDDAIGDYNDYDGDISKKTNIVTPPQPQLSTLQQFGAAVGTMGNKTIKIDMPPELTSKIATTTLFVCHRDICEIVIGNYEK
ncbi:hypothetical protein VIGAN_04128500 [Vigna angularis var. angularis]|uniref:Uncharacterized protein n=1 Tax=Vigna angularis var. angularis TaxID=157739 RepID=A0A0S3RTU5_PHAAN|nr:hypothetical protein VIGAN_04128500 [Vigna angularis var. angularis]